MDTPDSEAAQAAQRPSAEHDRPDALARGLLLEAADVITQASELISDNDASVVLSRHADELTRIATHLPTRPR